MAHRRDQYTLKWRPQGTIVRLAAICTLVLSLLAGAWAPATAAPSTSAQLEQFRPAYHFTPDKNWMNDPNGLIYYRGTYHLFFQHNPSGNTWGNMSWGHATSPDLINWTEQPIAIRQTLNDAGEPIEDIFSGSAVVDTDNTSGFGTTKNPPLVAIYTSAYTDKHPEHKGKQAQSLAYSTDAGKTWTKYAGNPVLDQNSANFRDPKVFRYEGKRGSYWVMAAVEATDHKVVLYKSTNLKDWTFLSDFGPANATGGLWECPDLFPLTVRGTGERKWVLIVNINPGGVAGGSAGQYFVGEFDGKTFTSESSVTTDPLPAGQTLADFDSGDYDGWTVDNEPGNQKNGPWGDSPAAGALPGQQSVSGFVGDGLVNGFNDGDWPIGTMESPSFTITKDYVNFLVGGGKHPRVENSQLGNEPPAGTLLFDGFEFPDGTDIAEAGWDVGGDFEAARNPSTSGGDNYIGQKRINTWEGGPNGDNNKGTLTSPEFTVDDKYVSFLIGGGGRSDGSLSAQLLVDGQVVRSATGKNDGVLNWQSWDVSEFAGQQARLRINDQADGGWGHLTFDHPVLGPERAKVRSLEETVNLIVDGKVVRSSTGANSEVLDWTSWDVSEFAGRQAAIRIVDQNRWGWGHIMADQFMTADAPARSRLERYDWLDWGRDDYASVTFSGVPGGKIVTIGWMNNWDYANDVPTSPWRSAMTLPRELALEPTAAGPRLVQQVVSQVDTLRKRPVLDLGPRRLSAKKTLPVSGDTVQIDAVIRPGSAKRVGLSVLGDDKAQTLIGYDRAAGRLYVDRTASGDVDFHPAFSSVDDAPVSLDRHGRLRLQVFVDRSSVEVFAQGGRRTITDQVFPPEGADRLGLFAEGGTATVESLTVTPLKPMESRR